MEMLMLEATRDGKKRTTKFCQLSTPPGLAFLPSSIFLSFSFSSDSTALLSRLEELIGMVKLLGLPLCVTVALRRLCQANAASARAKFPAVMWKHQNSVYITIFRRLEIIGERKLKHYAIKKTDLARAPVIRFTNKRHCTTQ